MIRILQLIHTAQRRGAETFACQLSKRLASHDCEVVIATIYSNPDTDIKFDFQDLAFERKRLFPRMMDLRQLHLYIVKGKFDVVQANAGDTLKYAALAKRIYGYRAPLIFRNASTISQYLGNPLKKLFNGLLLRQADYIASVSEKSREDILEQYPFLKSKISVLPIGIELSMTINTVARKTTPLIVHVGGFTFEKDHDSVLRIFQKVKRELPDVTLWLVGDGPLRVKIETQVEEKNLTESIKFFGFVSKPMDFISAADVLILPSRIEGLPGVILESFYCRVPVVANNTGGVAEIVYSETGYLIEKGNESAFSHQVVDVLRNRESQQVRQKTEAAYRLVTDSYSNAKVAKQFLSLYKRVISEN